MTFTGLTASDFAIFSVPGLEERMKILIAQLRPKLVEIGNELAPTISTLIGEEFHPHVAKHARRTINPPNDTWVAWASDKRGYKKHPHFQVGLWSSHMFIWFALIYESPLKEIYAKRIQEQLDRLYTQIPADFEWSWDHMQPTSMRHGDYSKVELDQQLIRVQNVKKAELLCGLTIPNNDPILRDGPALLDKITQTIIQLAPLYTIDRN